MKGGALQGGDIGDGGKTLKAVAVLGREDTITRGV